MIPNEPWENIAIVVFCLVALAGVIIWGLMV